MPTAVKNPLAPRYIVDEGGRMADWNSPFQHLIADPLAVHLQCAESEFWERFPSAASAPSPVPVDRLLLEHPRYGTMRCRVHARPLRDERGQHTRRQVTLEVLEWEHREHALFDEIAALWSAETSWDRFRLRVARPKNADPMIHLALAALGQKRRGRVLELEAGPRGLDSPSSTLHESNPRVLRQLSRRQKSQSGRHEFLSGPPNAIAGPPRFDTVISVWCGLRADVELTVRCASRLLRPGGRFLFLAARDARELSSLLHGIDPDAARRLAVVVPEKDLTAMLLRHGFGAAQSESLGPLSVYQVERRARPKSLAPRAASAGR